MRAIAACQFTLSRFEAWRRTVVVFTGGVLLALLFWFTSQPVALHWTVAAGIGLVALAALGLGASLLRAEAVSLRWDGHDWHFGSARAAGHEPQMGVLSVSVDLGSWMLLRFRPHGPGRWPRATWLPVQRSGLEPQWHTLRCAVYSPRPARDAAQDAGAAADL